MMALRLTVVVDKFPWQRCSGNDKRDARGRETRCTGHTT